MTVSARRSTARRGKLLHSQTLDRHLPDLQHRHLIRNAQHPDDLPHSVAGTELGERGEVVERALGVGEPHCGLEEPDRAEFARVVPAAVGAKPSQLLVSRFSSLDAHWREIMGRVRRNSTYFCEPGRECRSRLIRKPYFLAHSIALSTSADSPFRSISIRQSLQSYGRKGEKERSLGLTLPRDVFEKRFARPGLDRPEREWQTDPIQPGSGDLGKVVLGLRGGTVALQYAGARAEKEANESVSFLCKLTQEEHGITVQ